MPVVATQGTGLAPPPSSGAGTALVGTACSPAHGCLVPDQGGFWPAGARHEQRVDGVPGTGGAHSRARFTRMGAQVGTPRLMRPA